MDSSMFLGNGCQGGLVPALGRAPFAHVHSLLGLKHFLPFSLQPNREVHLLPGYSSSQAVSHYKGTKHAKKLKSLEVPKCKHKTTRENGSKQPVKNLSPSTKKLQSSKDNKESSPHPVPPPPDQSGTDVESKLASKRDESPCPTPEDGKSETEEEKALRLLYCSLCKVAVNSASQLEAHNSGTKHKTMLEARNGNGSIKSFPRPGVKSKLTTPAATSMGLQNKTFHCETCDVHVNSETQLKQHISSRRHKDRVAGKPAKPKYSPYSKTQKGQSKPQTLGTKVKLSLSEERCQRLTATIVPSHFAAVAAAAVGPAFQLRASSLFQTQSLPATLLRPAPGPVRTTHTPVLFAPY